MSVGLAVAWTNSEGKEFNLYQVEICLCCMLVHANGECCEGNVPDEEVATHGLPDGTWPEGTELTLGRLDHESVCGATCEGGCEDAGFSWSSCHWCGSSLGGDRFYAVAWVPAE